MSNRLKVWALALSSLAAMAMAHDFHVSRLSIDYHPDKDRIALTLHTFVDDLELALEKQYGLNGPMARSKGLPHMGELDLATSTEHRLTDSLVEDYLRRRIRLEHQGKALTWRYLGKEPSPQCFRIGCQQQDRFGYQGMVQLYDRPLRRSAKCRDLAAQW